MVDGAGRLRLQPLDERAAIADFNQVIAATIGKANARPVRALSDLARVAHGKGQIPKALDSSAKAVTVDARFRPDTSILRPRARGSRAANATLHAATASVAAIDQRSRLTLQALWTSGEDRSTQSAWGSSVYFAENELMGAEDTFNMLYIMRSTEVSTLTEAQFASHGIWAY